MGIIKFGKDTKKGQFDGAELRVDRPKVDPRADMETVERDTMPEEEGFDAYERTARAKHEAAMEHEKGRSKVVITRLTEQEDNQDEVVNFRIAIGRNDLIMVTPRQLNNLFVEMAKKFDSDVLLHLLWKAHDEQHDEAEHEKSDALNSLRAALSPNGFTLQYGGKKKD